MVTVNVPGAFAPTVTFIAFAVQAKVRGSDALNMTQAFTSLALIVLVSEPAAKFLRAVPTLTASLGCFERVQEYLLSASREDGRSLWLTFNHRPATVTPTARNIPLAYLYRIYYINFQETRNSWL
jgi:hypothetical protein